MNLRKIGCESLNLIERYRNMIRWRAFVNTVVNRVFLIGNYQFFKQEPVDLS